MVPVLVILDKVVVRVQVNEMVRTVVQAVAADGAVSLEAQELQVKEITVVPVTVTQAVHNRVVVAEVQVALEVLILLQMPQAAQVVQVLLHHYLALQSHMQVVVAEAVMQQAVQVDQVSAVQAADHKLVAVMRLLLLVLVVAEAAAAVQVIQVLRLCVVLFVPSLLMLFNSW